MLEAEQYLAIYFLSVLLINKKDVKILCSFLCVDFLVDNIIYSYLHYSPKEYLMLVTLLEFTFMVIVVQWVKQFWIKNIFILCYMVTLTCPLFLLTIDHWITRDDNLSYYLFIFCNNVARYSNEVFLTYLLYSNRTKDLKTNFWQVFIAFNYLAVLIR